jgi:hypothetical protein
MLVGRDIEVDCRRRLDVRSFSSSLPRLGLRTSVGRESGGDRREGSASGADAQLAIPRAPGRIGDECRSRKCHIPTRNLHAGLAGGRLPRSGTVRISSYFRFLNSSLRPLSGNERFCDSRHSPAAARLCASRTRARNQRRTTRRIRGFYNDSGAERPPGMLASAPPASSRVCRSMPPHCGEHRSATALASRATALPAPAYQGWPWRLGRLPIRSSPVWPCWSVCLPRNHCHLPLREPESHRRDLSRAASYT